VAPASGRGNMFRCRWQCDLRRYGRQPSACAISDLAIASNAGRRPRHRPQWRCP